MLPFQLTDKYSQVESSSSQLRGDMEEEGGGLAEKAGQFHITV